MSWCWAMERVNKWMKKLYLTTNFKNVERQAMIHVERLATFSSILSVPQWQYGRPPTPVVKGIKVGQAKNKLQSPGDPVHQFLRDHFKGLQQSPPGKISTIQEKSREKILSLSVCCGVVFTHKKVLLNGYRIRARDGPKSTPSFILYRDTRVGRVEK